MKLKQASRLKVAGVAFALMLIGVTGCNNSGSDILSANDSSNVNSVTVSTAYSEEVTNMSNTAISGMTTTQLNGAREEEIVTNLKDLDDRFACATVTVVRTGTKDAPSGTITIDFGTGCTDKRGVTRKGKIIISYEGFRFVPGFKQTITYDGYYRNDTGIIGTKIVTNVSPNMDTFPRFNVQTIGEKITFGDGKFVTRDANITHEWRRALNPINDTWAHLAGGTASGTNRRGIQYNMTILTDLIYSRSCELTAKIYIPVQGTKEIKTDTKDYILDYGTGECDDLVTVTVNGQTKTIEVSNEGN